MSARARSSVVLPGLQRRLAKSRATRKAIRNLLFVAEQKLANRAAHLLCSAGSRQSACSRNNRLFFLDLGFAFEKGVGLKQREGLAVAPIRGVDVFLIELAANIRDAR